MNQAIDSLFPAPRYTAPELLKALQRQAQDKGRNPYPLGLQIQEPDGWWHCAEGSLLSFRVRAAYGYRQETHHGN